MAIGGRAIQSTAAIRHTIVMIIPRYGTDQKCAHADGHGGSCGGDPQTSGDDDVCEVQDMICILTLTRLIF